MTDGRGQDRGLSSTAGMVLFITIGALLTGAGAYLLLELGSQDIGQTVTTAFDARQEGDAVVIEHTTGDPVAGGNLRVEGGVAGEIPDRVDSGTQIRVTPTAEEVVLLFEDGRVSQELARIEARLTRLRITVQGPDGAARPHHPVGVYDVDSDPAFARPQSLLRAVDRRGAPPEPLFAGLTDEDGQFVTATTFRDGLEAGGEYVVLAASTGPEGARTYNAGRVEIDERENRVTIVLSGSAPART